MKIERRFLRSKLARQIFGLVVLSTLVPTVLLFAYSIVYVEQQLASQAKRRMHDSTKLLGLQLLERLELYADSLAMIAGEIAAAPEGERDVILTAEARFDWVGLAGADGSIVVTLRGNGALGALPAEVSLGGWQLRLLDVGNRRFVELSEPLPGRRDGTRIVGRAAADKMLASLVVAMPEWASVAILDAKGRPVYASRPQLPPSFFEVAWAAAPRRELFSWRLGADEQLGYSWPIYMRGRFGVPSWTVALSEPHEQVIASSGRLWLMLPLVVGLSIAVVCLVSVVQIRRRLEPVDQLKQAAQRLAAGDLGARADLPPKDEFGELAQSFNAMANQIERTFRALTTRADIDRAVLSSLDRREIAAKLLRRLPGMVPCEALSLTLVDGVQGERFSLGEGGSLTPQRDEVVLGSEEMLFLGRLDDPEDARTLCDVPAAFRPPVGTSNDTWVFPVEVRGRIGAVLAVTRRDGQVSSDHRALVGQLAGQLGIGLTNAQLVQEIDRANWEMVEALSRAIDAKSPWTAGHSTRVTKLGMAIARRLDFDDKALESVHRGGLLHDIGKLGIPVEILDKPGLLTTAEMEVMKQHPTIGARIVEPISAYSEVIAAVRHHHERYDGEGYPDGLRGERIPLIARIFAVADVYDSLVSPRPYREAWTRKKVIEYIREGAGTRFDPRVVDAFLAEVPHLPVPDREAAEPDLVDAGPVR